MYTRCQACHTVHPVNAAILAQGGGKYRCGKCHKVGNALESLFDEWPQAKQQAARPGSLPELGLTLSVAAHTRSSAVPEESGPVDDDSTIAETPDASDGWPRQRILWVSAASVLTFFIALNLVTFFQQPLPGLSRMQSTLVRLGIKNAPPEPSFRALDRIELLSRELKAHPFRPGVLQLTATIVNRANRAQPYPDIEVTLYEVHGRQLSRKIFEPGDYLTRSAELRNGMVPQAYLTLSVEMPDPGDSAVGFELQFR